MSAKFECTGRKMRVYGTTSYNSSQSVAHAFAQAREALERMSSGSMVEIVIELYPIPTNSIIHCVSFLNDIADFNKVGGDVHVAWKYRKLPSMEALANAIATRYDFVQKVEY